MGALGGLLQGMLGGIELRNHLQRAKDEHALTQQAIDQQNQAQAMKMIGDRLNLEMMGARPVDENGLVNETAASYNPDQSSSTPGPAAPPSSQSTMNEMLGTSPSPSGPAIAGGAPTAAGNLQVPTAMGPPAPAATPGSAPAVVAGQPAAIGGITRKANKGQVVTVPWFGGQNINYELPTREEQIARQNQMAEMQQVREKMGLAAASQHVMQAFGRPAAPDIVAAFPGMSGVLLMPDEQKIWAEKAAEFRQKQIREVTPGAALVNTGTPSANGQPTAGGAAGTPGAAGGSAQTVFQAPPLEPPNVRAAKSWYAQSLGKQVNQLNPQEQTDAVAKWTEATMNPLEKQRTQGEIAMQPLTAAEKRSTIATQALQRQIHQQELDLASDPDTVNMAAAKYLQTGQMPALGQNSTLLKGKIMGRATEMAIEKGLSPENIPALQDTYKALSASLTDLQKRNGQILAFEKGGAANLDNFIALAQKQVDSGSPLINRTLRGSARTLTGSPDQAAADAARVAAFNEISKILSGSLGNAGVSDSGRKEAEDLLRGDYTMPQLLNVAKVLRTDMKNRSDAYGQQITSIRQQMQNLTKPAAGESSGQIVVKGGDGSVHPFDTEEQAKEFEQLVKSKGGTTTRQ